MSIRQYRQILNDHNRGQRFQNQIDLLDSMQKEYSLINILVDLAKRFFKSDRDNVRYAI